MSSVYILYKVLRLWKTVSMLLSYGWLFRQYLYVIRFLISLVSSSSTAVKLQTSIFRDFKTKSK